MNTLSFWLSLGTEMFLTRKNPILFFLDCLLFFGTFQGIQELISCCFHLPLCYNHSVASELSVSLRLLFPCYRGHTHKHTQRHKGKTLFVTYKSRQQYEFSSSQDQQVKVNVYAKLPRCGNVKTVLESRRDILSVL